MFGRLGDMAVGVGAASLAEAFEGGRICFMRVIDALLQESRGQSRHEIVRGIRSVSEHTGELSENNGARQPGVAGLGCRSAPRYS